MSAGSVTVPASFLPSQRESLDASLGWLTSRLGESLGRYPGHQTIYPSTAMQGGMNRLNQYVGQDSPWLPQMNQMASVLSGFGTGQNQLNWANPNMAMDYYQKYFVDPSQYALQNEVLPQIRSQMAQPGGPGYSSSWQQQALTDAITKTNIANQQQLANLMMQQQQIGIDAEKFGLGTLGPMGMQQMQYLTQLPFQQAQAGMQLGQIPMEWDMRNQQAQLNDITSLLGPLIGGATARMDPGYTAEGPDPWIQTAGLLSGLGGTLLGAGTDSILGRWLFGNQRSPGTQDGGGNSVVNNLLNQGAGSITDYIGSLINPTSLDFSTWLSYFNPADPTSYLGGDTMSSVGGSVGDYIASLFGGAGNPSTGAGLNTAASSSLPATGGYFSNLASGTLAGLPGILTGLGVVGGTALLSNLIFGGRGPHTSANPFTMDPTALARTMGMEQHPTQGLDYDTMMRIATENAISPDELRRRWIAETGMPVPTQESFTAGDPLFGVVWPWAVQQPEYATARQAYNDWISNNYNWVSDEGFQQWFPNVPQYSPGTQTDA